MCNAWAGLTLSQTESVQAHSATVGELYTFHTRENSLSGTAATPAEKRADLEGCQSVSGRLRLPGVVCPRGLEPVLHPQQ